MLKGERKDINHYLQQKQKTTVIGFTHAFPMYHSITMRQFEGVAANDSYMPQSQEPECFLVHDLSIRYKL